MNNTKDNCNLCGAYIPKEDQNQLWILAGDCMRDYCSKCRNIGSKISKKVNKKIEYFKKNDLYYDIEDECRKIEGLYRNKTGNIKISFTNAYS